MRASSLMECRRLQGSPTGGPADHPGHPVDGVPMLGVTPCRGSGVDR